MDLQGVPSSVLEALQAAARSLGIRRLALVGGAVRDQLLHQRSGRAWLGVPDLDWVVEGDAPALVEELSRQVGPQRISAVQSMGPSAQWRFSWMGSRWIWQRRGRALPRSGRKSCGCGREPFKQTLRVRTSRSMPWPLI